jgi:DASS family divalent anion:Na+ symporter
MAAVILCSHVTSLLTQTVSFDHLFAPYSQSGIWLIVLSFFLAQGLIKSQLALRVAYGIVCLCGKSTLGLAYAIIASECVLAPFVPSLVARCAGIIFPITSSLAREGLGQRDEGDHSTPAFLLLASVHGSLICSNLFLTAMAGNPLCAEMAAPYGVHMTWNLWAQAAFLPGIVSLITVPYLIYHLCPPKQRSCPDAPVLAKAKLEAMGALRYPEIATLCIFSLTLALWVLGARFGISSTCTAMLGLVLLLSAGVLSWKDCLAESAGWDTLIWMGAMIGLGSQLRSLGFFDVLSQAALERCGHWHWGYAFLLLVTLYYYSHYLFASTIAHALAMFLVFFVTCVEVGTPPTLAFFVLAFSNNLFGGLTHYGCGPAPLFFGLGHITVVQWWRVGFVVCTYTFFLWIGLGSLWWSYLGLW